MVHQLVDLMVSMMVDRLVAWKDEERLYRRAMRWLISRSGKGEDYRLEYG